MTPEHWSQAGKGEKGNTRRALQEAAFKLLSKELLEPKKRSDFSLRFRDLLRPHLSWSQTVKQILKFYF